jgi:hypothetical protein
MKRITKILGIFLLTAVLMLFLAACGASKPAEQKETEGVRSDVNEWLADLND